MVHEYLSSLPVRHVSIFDFDRSRSIGASEIATICGLNKWENVQDLYKKKLGVIPPTKETPPMEWGKRHEPAVREKLADEYPSSIVLEPELHYPGVMVSKQNEHFHASPDAFLRNEDGTLWLVEIKTSSVWQKKTWGNAGSQIFPMNYRYQIQWSLYITGLQKAILPALIGLSDYREYTVERNDKLIDTMRRYAEDFLGSLEKKQIPSSGVSETRGQNMLTLFPQPKEVDVYVSAGAKHNKAAHRLLWIKQKTAELKAEKENLQEMIKKDIGEAEGMTGRNWKAKWTRFDKTRTDWKAVDAAGGVDMEIRTAHTTTTKSDRLDIKKTT